MVDFTIQEKSTGSDYWAETLERVEGAVQWRRSREGIGDRSWINCRRMAAGKHWNQNTKVDPTSDSPNRLITINSTQSMLQDYLPFLVRQHPGFNLSPRPKAASDITDIDAYHQDSRLVSRALEYFWDEYRFQDAYREAVADGLEIGHGIVEVGWATEVDDAKTTKEPETITELDSFIRVDAPYARRIDPLLFHFDPTALDHSLRTARWCAVFTFTTKRDLIWNKIYKKSIRELIAEGAESPEDVSAFLVAAFDGETTTEEDLRLFSQLDDGPVVLLRVWDKKFNKYLVFARGIKEPLIERTATDLASLDTFFPFTMWKFSGRPGEPFSESVVSLTRDLTLERNRIRTIEFAMRRKHGAAKFFVDENVFGPAKLAQLKSSDSEIILVTGSPDMAVKVFQGAQIPSDNYSVDRIIGDDMREMVGLSALQTGAPLPSRTSAKEVDARERNTSLKLEERKGKVDDLAHGMGTHLIQLMRQHMDSNTLLEVLGETGERDWVSMSPEQIKREYTLKVVSSSKPPEDPVSAAALFGDLFTKLVNEAQPALQAQGKGVDVQRLASIWLEKLGLPETEKIIIDLPPVEPLPEGGAGGVVPGAAPSVDSTGQAIAQAGVAPASAAQGPRGAAGA